MAVQTQRMTIEEFEQFVHLPQNVERRFEYLGGEVVELVTNNYASLIAANILFFIKLYLHQGTVQGYVTGEAGGYIVAGHRYLPDVAFISKTRQPEPSHATYNPLSPDLAVEVLSPTDKPKDVRVKLSNYLASGTVVWIVDPDFRQIEVHAPVKATRVFGVDGTLDGGDILPGFTLAVKDVFPD